VTSLERRLDPDAITWVAQRGDIEPDRLHRRTSEETSLCLVLAFSPAPAEHDELDVALDSGVPMILWNRNGVAPVDFFSEVRATVFADGLGDLPEQVRLLREEAQREKHRRDHLGSCLTLLWDNADRMPEPYVRLRAPD